MINFIFKGFYRIFGILFLFIIFVLFYNYFSLRYIFIFYHIYLLGFWVLAPIGFDVNYYFILWYMIYIFLLYKIGTKIYNYIKIFIS